MTTQWVGQLRRQLIDAGELLVEQSRGRRPNVYVIPYERCHACQQANPKVEFGVDDPNPKLTPNQPQTNPKVTEASGPALARIEPSKEVKEVKEETVFSDAPQPQTEKTVARDQSPVQAKAKARTSPPPIGEARSPIHRGTHRLGSGGCSRGQRPSISRSVALAVRGPSLCVA